MYTFFVIVRAHECLGEREKDGIFKQTLCAWEIPVCQSLKVGYFSNQKTSEASYCVCLVWIYRYVVVWVVYSVLKKNPKSTVEEWLLWLFLTVWPSPQMDCTHLPIKKHRKRIPANQQLYEARSGKKTFTIYYLGVELTVRVDWSTPPPQKKEGISKKTKKQKKMCMPVSLWMWAL